MKILLSIFFISMCTSPTFASNGRNWCAELFRMSERQQRAERANAKLRGHDLQFLKSHANQKNLIERGFDVIETTGVLNEDAIQELLAILPNIGKQVMNQGEFASFDFKFADIPFGPFNSFDAFPPHIKQVLTAFIGEITAELNRQLGAREGVYKFEHGTLRNFSRDDLRDTAKDYHFHENGFISATIALKGLGSVIVPSGSKKADPSTFIHTQQFQLALMTDGQRSRFFNIPDTLHGSPLPEPGQQRLVLLLSFKIELVRR